MVARERSRNSAYVSGARSDSGRPYASSSLLAHLLARLISLNTWWTRRATLVIQDARRLGGDEEL
jgi:hypothetical protein